MTPPPQAACIHAAVAERRELSGTLALMVHAVNADRSDAEIA
jgi:hypothetical protein